MKNAICGDCYLKVKALPKLTKLLDNMQYTCGATFDDVIMPEDLESVHTHAVVSVMQCVFTAVKPYLFRLWKTVINILNVMIVLTNHPL